MAIRLAVIGAGRIGQIHASNAARNPGVQLAGIADAIPEAAQKLANWAASKDAMMLYGKNFAITAQPGVAAPLANVPKDYEARLVKMDFNWAAENRERILAEWTKRYGGKVEKR